MHVRRHHFCEQFYSLSYFFVLFLGVLCILVSLPVIAQENSGEEVVTPIPVESSVSVPQPETSPQTESSPEITETPPIETAPTEPEVPSPVEPISEPEDLPSETAPTEPEISEPTSSITLIDTGDSIIPVIEGDITKEAKDIVTLFSNDDVFVEIEVIFSDLDTEVDEVIQNDPTLADNTDEDPNVDLVDPSIIADPAGPIPEPETELPPEDTSPVLESQGASESTLALLSSLLTPETLSVRRYDKEIIIDETATHTCRADIFRADLASSEFSRARVTLFQNRKKNLPSFLEIGALPAGIDVVFRSNEEYSYTPSTRETVIEFDIKRQIGADVGDFTIPIIYTLRDVGDSSVVCQINILND